MKLKLAICLVSGVGILAACAPLFAHHGTGVAYETEKTVTVKGMVVEWI